MEEIEKLKARVYDLLVEQQKIQNELMNLNNKIANFVPEKKDA